MHTSRQGPFQRPGGWCRNSFSPTTWAPCCYTVTQEAELAEAGENSDFGLRKRCFKYFSSGAITYLLWCLSFPSPEESAPLAKLCSPAVARCLPGRTCFGDQRVWLLKFVLALWTPKDLTISRKSSSVFIFSAHVCIGSLDLDDPEEVCIQSRAPGSAMLWQNMLLDHLILISK